MAEMTSGILQSMRLLLAPMTREDALAMIDALSPADRAQVTPDWLARIQSPIPPDVWTLGFTISLRRDGAAIGQCGFKGPPAADGMVELAYGVDSAHQGKGYATEAAAALVSYAFGVARVRVVRAHTLPEQNASTRVLEKCGFRRVGEVMDPEDGLVWRWERSRADA